MNAMKETMTRAKSFAQEHAITLAKEIREWQDSGTLDGTGEEGLKLRELAKILELLDASGCMRIAESLATRAALDLLVAQPLPVGELPQHHVPIALLGAPHHFTKAAWAYAEEYARAALSTRPELIDSEIDALMTKIQAFGFACYMREPTSTQTSMQFELRNAVRAALAGYVKVSSELATENEALRRDAERYRWLRDKADGEIVFDHTFRQDDGGHRFVLHVPFDGRPIDNDADAAKRMDAAIDAALAARGEKR